MKYLYRLKVDAIQANIPIRDGPSAIRKEHVNHYISNLDDRDLARLLTMLRLGDADDLEETMQECQNIEVREAHASMGSRKFRQRLTSQAAQMLAKPARVVREIFVESEKCGTEYDFGGSDTDSDRRNVYMTAASDRSQKTGDPIVQNKRFDQERQYNRGTSQKMCMHSGSKRHEERGCWKRLTCQKCGRKGHPADKCDYVFSVCKNIHDKGKCPMKQFYNTARQWYLPTKHAGMLPE